MAPLAVYLGTKLWTSQQAVNDTKGAQIGVAVRKFHDERGVYPETLGELKPGYVKSIPWWWHGFVKRPYIYWIDSYDGERANLKYCPELWSGRFFGFDDLKWSTQTL